MYLYDKNRITYFAVTDRRSKRIPFGIKAEDRTRHMYIIGKTGMGKSTLIENMAVQDIKNGEGFAFIDPHGKSAALLLDYIPPERIKDVIYFAPFDMDNPISFNIMEDIGADKRHLVANGLMSVFKKIWVDVWSARMEYILANVLLALLEYPESTLLGVNSMLADKAYRKKVVDNIKDPGVKAFWEQEYAKYSERYTQEATPAIQNKIGQFTSNPLIRNIIGQKHSSFDLRKMMDERKILIVNLSKGQVGEGNANLLGAMLITKIYLSAMSRAELHESELKKLPNFYLYVDEFQSFANESFANILSEARKYKLSLIMAHQYIEQMSEEVTAAVFGNVGTQVMFRVGATDAEHLEKEYAPVFTAEDMVNLGFTQIYLKLMIDGVASNPFSATTLPPIAPPAKSSREEVIASSRETYSHPRTLVEEEIAKWYGGAKTEKITKTESPSEVPTSAPLASSEKPAMPSERTSSYPPRVGRTTRGAQSRRSETRPPRIEKTEKPFEKAFQELSSQAPAQQEGENKIKINIETKKVSLDTLSQTSPSLQKNTKKSPSERNLTTLKSALADVLKEEAEKPTKIPIQVINTPKEVSVSTPAPKAPEPEVKKIEEPRETKKEEPKAKEITKEVPEDILTNILFGED